MKTHPKTSAAGLESTKTRRRRVLETAAQVICEQGFEKASMQQIAEACELTKAGLYHYVRSKDHLLSEIMNYGMDVFEEQVLSEVLPIVDPIERLEATMEKNVRLVTEGRNKEITVILHEHDTLTGEALAQINARKKRYVRFLESSFTEAMRQGRMRVVDPKIAAFSFLGMINWIYKWYRPDGESSAERIAVEMRRVFFGGLVIERDRRGDADAEGGGVRAARDVGIAGYGAYVPRYRVRTAAIASTWRPSGAAAVAEKSVPGPDEDVVTMSIEAARTAIDRGGVDPAAIGAVWVGSESKPYAVKPSATIVAEAVGIAPATVAADMEFACKAGSEAMQAAVAFVGSGMVEGALAIGMDTAQSKPGDALETTAGCGGAAFLFAAAERSLATVEASLSHVTDTPDFFRREGSSYPEHGGRFTGEPSYFEHTLAASRRLLDELGAEPGDFAHAVFHQPVPKFARRVAAELGFDAGQIAAGLVAPRMGNAYSGSSLLGLAAVLDVARPGERIFFCSYGSGAGSDAFAFRVGERIAERRGGPKVEDYLARRREIDDYGHYLRLTRKIQRS